VARRQEEAILIGRDGVEGAEQLRNHGRGSELSGGERPPNKGWGGCWHDLCERLFGSGEMWFLNMPVGVLLRKERWVSIKAVLGSLWWLITSC
jgi:hypothetical protein